MHYKNVNVQRPLYYPLAILGYPVLLGKKYNMCFAWSPKGKSKSFAFIVMEEINIYTAMSSAF